MVEKRKERVSQPAEHDALCVSVTKAAPTEPRDVVAQVGKQQLDRYDDSERGGDEQGDERRQPVRAHEPGVDERGTLRFWLTQGPCGEDCDYPTYR